MKNVGKVDENEKFETRSTTIQIFSHLKFVRILRIRALIKSRGKFLL